MPSVNSDTFEINTMQVVAADYPTGLTSPVKYNNNVCARPKILKSKYLGTKKDANGILNF
jgi:hypothetical protein